MRFYLITVRHPYDTAVSCQKIILPPALQGQVTIIAAKLVHWQFMTLSFMEHTSGTARKMLVPYEGLIREPLTHAARLHDFLNRECGIEEHDDQKIEVMAKTVNPKLWRTRHEIPFAQIPDATDEQKAQYEFVQRKIHDPSEPFEPAKYRMNPGWQEYLVNLRLFLNYYAQTSRAQ